MTVLAIGLTQCSEGPIDHICPNRGQDMVSSPAAPLQVFEDKEEIDSVNDAYRQLRAEAKPEDQLSVSEQDQLIHVYHFTCDQHSQVRHTLVK